MKLVNGNAIRQRRRYLRAARERKKKKKEGRKDKLRRAAYFDISIRGTTRAIDLHFRLPPAPLAETTSRFHSPIYPRNYDGSREQPSLIAISMWTKRALARGRAYYFQFAASTYAHLYLLDGGATYRANPPRSGAGTLQSVRAVQRG